MYCNANGLRSKYSSFVNIVKKVQPSIIAVCETKLGKKSKLNSLLPGYSLFPKAIKLGQGGLLLAVKKNMFVSSMVVTSSLEDNILSVRINVSATLNLRLILAYGPQESESADERQDFMTELSIELQNCIDNGDVPILLGDLNAKIDVNEEGDIIALSGNGKLLNKVIKEYNLSVVNFSEKCEGKWTHVIRTTGVKSLLDYVISSSMFEQFVDSMTIDEDCIFCPFTSRKKRGGGSEQVFSDHNTIIMDLLFSMPKINKQSRSYRWKMNDDSKVALGEITKIENYVPPNISGTSQQVYDTFEAEVNRLLSDTSLQIKMKSKEAEKYSPSQFTRIYKVIALFGAKGKTQRNVAAKYKKLLLDLNRREERKERAQCFKKAVTSLTVNGRFSRENFWKVRKSVYKKTESCSSVFSRDGGEVFDVPLIKDAYREEFDLRLSHREIHPCLRTFEERSNQLANLYVEEAAGCKGPPISMSELTGTIQDLKNGAPGSDNIPPDFYKNTEEGFLIFLLEVLNQLKASSYTPSQWENTLITTIYKNKGSRKFLVNYRGIFLTQIISKIYERIFFSRSQEVLKRVSKLQAGSRPERGSLDDLFLLKGCIDHAKYMNCPCYVTLYDFKQCFDALWLEDCIISLWKLGLRDDALSTMYNMNKKANISIKTPLGTSRPFTKERIVKQGTVSGPPMCSTSTAEFAAMNKVTGFPIGSTNINSMILVDDIANVNLSADGVIMSHKFMQLFSMIKRLPLSGPKCFILPINVPRLFTIPVLSVGDFTMEIVDKALYLGLFHNSKGNNVDMIDDRVQKATTCMVSILAMCQEVTLGIYIIRSLILGYKMIFVPTLLYGAQVWTRFTGDDMKRFSSLQLRFLKRMLRVPRSTCNSITLLELGIRPIQFEIESLKLSFLYHVLSLESDDPVRQVYLNQLKYEFEPNWANEVRDLRAKYQLSVSDAEIKSLSKDEWKNMVLEAVTKHVLIVLNTEKNSKKHSAYPDATELVCQQYFSVLNGEYACVLFSVRARVADIKEFRSYRYDEDDHTCRTCNGDNETLSHILSECSALATRTCKVEDVYSDDITKLECVAARVKEFTSKTKQEKGVTNDTPC